MSTIEVLPQGCPVHYDPPGTSKLQGTYEIAGVVLNKDNTPSHYSLRDSDGRVVVAIALPKYLSLQS